MILCTVSLIPLTALVRRHSAFCIIPPARAVGTKRTMVLAITRSEWAGWQADLLKLAQAFDFDCHEPWYDSVISVLGRRSEHHQ